MYCKMNLNTKSLESSKKNVFPNLPVHSSDFHCYLHLLRQINWVYKSLRTKRSEVLGTNTHLLFFFMSQRGRKKCRHKNTQLWLGWKCGCLCTPVCCWEEWGMFLGKAKTQWFLSLQWKEGLAKRGRNLLHICGHWWYSGFLCMGGNTFSHLLYEYTCEFTNGNQIRCGTYDMKELLMIIQVFDIIMLSHLFSVVLSASLSFLCQEHCILYVTLD